MARSFLQYDVFTGEPLLGNQLAVFPDAQGLDASLMQRIAREMNFAESTFVTPPTWAGTNARMRIFTPAVEMPMAGHPVIGTTFALAETGAIAPGTPRVLYELNIGPLVVDLDWCEGRLAFVWMTQPNPAWGPIVEARAAVADALGLTADDLVEGLPLQQISCGVPFLYVPLRDAAAVDRAVSDAAACRRLAAVIGTELPIFLFAVDAASADPTTVVYSRMFAPGLGVVEDAATGSASGPLGCYLVKYLGGPDEAGPGGPEARPAGFVSRQGVKMGRASTVHISIATTQGVISDVKVGGEAVLVARGELLV